ncbi:MAG: glycine zipper 2TM domain-containing protein [Burkholderiales bacterium]|nr:glycine zipper 2TM domain-containing protein [Burkholderiales bacterium]
MSTTLESPVSAGTGPRNLFARNAWLAAGGLALTGLGLAAGLAWHPAPQSELLSAGSMEATRASLASNEAVVDTGAKAGDKLAEKSTTGTLVPLVANNGTQAPPARVAPNRSSPAHRTSPAQSQQYASVGSTTPLATQPAAVCAHCGVIEAVREVTVKGQGTGLGAVAGGVLGGAVGNQMGKGNGRAVMTVLGAIGGGFAGNEVEKRTRSEQIYEVRVRMDDGQVRTFQQKSAPTPGSRVTVEGNVLHITHGNGSGNGDEKMMRTSTGSSS